MPARSLELLISHAGVVTIAHTYRPGTTNFSGKTGTGGNTTSVSRATTQNSTIDSRIGVTADSLNTIRNTNYTSRSPGASYTQTIYWKTSDTAGSAEGSTTSALIGIIVPAPVTDSTTTFRKEIVYPQNATSVARAETVTGCGRTRTNDARTYDATGKESTTTNYGGATSDAVNGVFVGSTASSTLSANDPSDTAQNEVHTYLINYLNTGIPMYAVLPNGETWDRFAGAHWTTYTNSFATTWNFSTAQFIVPKSSAAVTSDYTYTVGGGGSTSLEFDNINSGTGTYTTKDCVPVTAEFTDFVQTITTSSTYTYRSGNQTEDVGTRSLELTTTQAVASTQEITTDYTTSTQTLTSTGYTKVGTGNTITDPGARTETLNAWTHATFISTRYRQLSTTVTGTYLEGGKVSTYRKSYAGGSTTTETFYTVENAKNTVAGDTTTSATGSTLGSPFTTAQTVVDDFKITHRPLDNGVTGYAVGDTIDAKVYMAHATGNSGIVPFAVTSYATDGIPAQVYDEYVVLVDPDYRSQQNVSSSVNIPAPNRLLFNWSSFNWPNKCPVSNYPRWADSFDVDSSYTDTNATRQYWLDTGTTTTSTSQNGVTYQRGTTTLYAHTVYLKCSKAGATERSVQEIGHEKDALKESSFRGNGGYFPGGEGFTIYMQGGYFERHSRNTAGASSSTIYSNPITQAHTFETYNEGSGVMIYKEDLYRLVKDYVAGGDMPQDFRADGNWFDDSVTWSDGS